MRGRWIVALGLLASACGGERPPQASAPASAPASSVRITDPTVTAGVTTAVAEVTHAVSSLPATSDGRPRLALVIDDLGFRRDRIQQLLALGLTMTYAVLPAEPRTAEVVAMLRSAGVPMIVHMPMQPRDYPRAQPGPCALLLAEPATWAATLRECAGRVPGAMGMNNHMGSALTEDAAAMRAVAAYLKERGWYFLDSVTSSGSVASDVMRAAAVPVIRRDVFLDDSRDEGQIAAQLQKALLHAQRHGSAVAIGHPYPETLQVLGAARDRGDFAPLELVSAAALAR